MIILSYVKAKVIPNPGIADMLVEGGLKKIKSRKLKSLRKRYF